jgi:hypothetical protein
MPVRESLLTNIVLILSTTALTVYNLHRHLACPPARSHTGQAGPAMAGGCYSNPPLNLFYNEFESGDTRCAYAMPDPTKITSFSVQASVFCDGIGPSTGPQ